SVEPLIKVLSDPNEKVKIGAIEALGRLNDPQSIGPLISCLGDAAENVSEKALWALIEIGDMAVTDLLKILDIFDDSREKDNAVIQHKVVRILGKIGNSRAIMPLISLVDHSSKGMAGVVMDALAAIDEHILKLCEEDIILKEALSWNRFAIARTLYVYKDKRAAGHLVSIIINTLNERDIKKLDMDKPRNQLIFEIFPAIAKNCCELLGVIGDENTVNALMAAYKSADLQTKQYIVYALGLIGIPKSVTNLLDILKDEKSQVSYKTVAFSLKRVSDDRLLTNLQRLITEPSAYIKQAAAYTLGVIGEAKSINVLITQINDASEEVRKTVIEALGRIGGESIVDPLAKMLRDQSDSVREIAVKIMGGLNSARSLEPLTQALKDSSEAVRISAINALGKLKDNRVPMNLLRLLKDASEKVREAAIFTLGNIKDQRAGESLIESLSDQSENVRRQAVEALGKIGSLAAVVPLLNMLTDANSLVRIKAFESIKNLGDRSVPHMIE
ncbi:MAG TPA: HEAT repeat domain-containing protein, partial [Candidatus Wallbacteria bacterium]|nr:HEAT repeat domain-containing protein [Candidatus Wallbacteria bacterium]